jgi:hypothetical protein
MQLKPSRYRRHDVRTKMKLLTAVAIGSCLLFMPTVTRAQAVDGGKDAGSVVIVEGANSDLELNEGDSTTPFSLRLPPDAACPGDTANDDWRVQSFMVPADTDVGSLRYRALRPDGDAYRGLRYPDGSIFTQAATDPNSKAGQPGRITSIPPLTFKWWPAGTIPPGRYKIGIACTPGATWKVEKYWDTEIEFSIAPDVNPGGLKWTAIPSDDPSASVATTSSGGGTTWIPVVVAAAAVATVVLVIRRRKSRSAAPMLKELQ